MRSPISGRAPARPRPSGMALVFAIAMILVIGLVGVALVRTAGQDRIDAARMGVRDRGLACAEAGLQYGRRFFGSRYDTSHGWNDYLSQGSGYRYDPGRGDQKPVLENAPRQTLGYGDGTSLDPGADLDGNGGPDFWVTLHDDDDERPVGVADDPARDNNETVILRAECINPGLTQTVAGNAVNAVLESVLTHVQGSSGYGVATRGSNATDLVGGR